MYRLAALFAVLFLLAGCGQTTTLQDLEGVHAKEPEIIQAYYNVDLHPNVVISCPDGPDGYGYATTTRDYDSIEFFETCPITREEGEEVDLGSGLEGQE